MLKIVTIVGARPQFVKAAVVSRAIATYEEKNVLEVIVHTGQHFDENMSHVFFEEMNIPKPDYNLGIHGTGHGAMTGQMIVEIETILLNENPDWVLLYGDTNSTLAGAIAASKLHIKIAHVEAGLRSFNMKMPEEVNRILTDRLSSLLFCPTQTAVDNLQHEGIKNWGDAEVLIAGDVMLDASLFYKEFAQRPSEINISNDFILCTIHRAENTDDKEKLYHIVLALNDIAQNTQIILPLHPRTRKKLAEMNNCDLSHNITLINPVGYLNIVYLLNHCSMVMTDSGGLQKEAFFFEKPCITLREETEWVELVESGANILVGSDQEKIMQAIADFKSLTIDFSTPLYGKGCAGDFIVEALSKNKG